VTRSDGRNRRMPPKPLSVDYWDDWYADKAAVPAVAEVMNRHLGLPPDLLAGILPAEAIGELTAELRLKPGDTLLDLACGRAGYGLMITRGSGARLTGIDVSAEALAQAREQAARLGVTDARFGSAISPPPGCRAPARTRCCARTRSSFPMIRPLPTAKSAGS
jgi:SAM-dependent methyltransferase